MPPKKSDTYHVTFHFNRSAILLSVPGSTSLTALKSQLLPAFLPLSATLPSPPKSTKDFQLYDETDIEGGEGLRNVEVEDGALGKTLSSLQWPKWKRLFISFRTQDGEFGSPEYTIPDVDDEAPGDVQVNEARE